MFVDLLACLRCPNDHDEVPLVAAASLTVDRRIVEGVLGCPVCRAEYPVHHGAVDFGRGGPAPAPAPAVRPDEQHLIRLAALLGLHERVGVYVLGPAGAPYIAGLAALSPLAHYVVLSALDDVDGAGIVIRGPGSSLPLATGSARGIALDDADPGMLRSAVRVLSPGGRLVAPAEAPVPDGLTILARDDRNWVGEREALQALSTIRRSTR